MQPHFARSVELCASFRSSPTSGYPELSTIQLTEPTRKTAKLGSFCKKALFPSPGPRPLAPGPQNELPYEGCRL